MLGLKVYSTFTEKCLALYNNLCRIALRFQTHANLQVVKIKKKFLFNEIKMTVTKLFVRYFSILQKKKTKKHRIVDDIHKSQV